MKSWAKSVLKAGVLAAGLFGFAFFTNAADDSCDPVPDCESLGYVKGLECKQNTSVSCPYDSNYKRCVNNDCETLGYTVTDKKSWCKTIIPCPTDSSYTLCKEKCADCVAPAMRSPYCPFGRVSAGTDECGNRCYTCAECTYDLDRGYDNPEYASLSCPAGQYVETIIKPLCPNNTALKYVCRPCPQGTTSLAANNASCVCDTANGYYRKCPDGAYCDIYKTDIFGTCYKPEKMCEGEDCEDPCQDDPGDCFCDGRKGYVSWNQSDPHYTYSTKKYTFLINDTPIECKKVLACSGYEGSTDSPVFDASHFDATYFSIITDPETGDYGFTRGSKTCYWVTGCSGDPYVEKTSAGDCCAGRIYTASKTYGSHTCGLCPCDGSKNVAHYPSVPVGRLYEPSPVCSYQGCYHATGCDVEGQHYSSSWSDTHFSYGNYVEFPECKEVTGCNVNIQNSQASDFTATQKSFFTTADVTNGARKCYYITGCSADNSAYREASAVREENCDAVELTWAPDSPQYMRRDSATPCDASNYNSASCYRCGTCVCDTANGYYYQNCPTGAVCETVGRCKHTIKGGTSDPDNDGCNNADGYVPATDTRDSHFTYGNEFTFNIGNVAQTCVKITGCNSSVDGSTTNAPSNSGNYIKPDYHTSTSRKLGATTCYWVTGCDDEFTYTSGADYGECIRPRGYKNTSCRDYGGKHCCMCTTLTCTEQFPTSSYIIYTTSSAINNYTCTNNGTQQADHTCYTCICDGEHCNGTSCGTHTVDCPRSTYPYTYCAHAQQGTACNTITRDSAPEGLCRTVAKGDYVTYYTNKNCIDNGTNECYMDVPNGCCREKACADYDDYKIEADERDTTRFNYDEISRCSGTGTRKCYRLKASPNRCNTTYLHYDLENTCLNANSCTLTCGTNNYNCYAQKTTKPCSYDTGHTFEKTQCDKTCYNCTSDTHSFCGRTCVNPLPLGCRGEYPVSSSARIDEHSYSVGTVQAGYSSGSGCYDLTCYKDNGCDNNYGYYNSNTACLSGKGNSGYSKCGYNSATGCYSSKTSGAVAKTCNSYSRSESCDSNCYDCSDWDYYATGNTSTKCFNPVAKTCGSYSMSGSCDSNCYFCNGVSKCTGSKNSTCYSPVAKACGDLGYYPNDGSCESSNPGYKCKNVTICSKTCRTPDGCDDNHCGSGCSSVKNTCSDYTVKEKNIPLNGHGTGGSCTPVCSTDTDKRYKGWVCDDGFCEENNICTPHTSCSAKNPPAHAHCISWCTQISGTYCSRTTVCTNWDCDDGYALNTSTGKCDPTCPVNTCSGVTVPACAHSTGTCTPVYSDCSTGTTVNTGWACNTGCHLKNGKCEEDCQREICDPAISSKPDHSSWTTCKAVDEYCNESTVNVGWVCDPGYHRNGNKCDPDCKNTCKAVSMPANAHCTATCDVINQYCNTTGESRCISWACNSGYYQSGNSCIYDDSELCRSCISSCEQGSDNYNSFNNCSNGDQTSCNTITSCLQSNCKKYTDCDCIMPLGGNLDCHYSTSSSSGGSSSGGDSPSSSD